MMAGGTVVFEAWNGQRTVKKMSEAFDKANSDAPGATKVEINGKLGDWELGVSGGYFSLYCDMRQWGQNCFKQMYVGQETVSWGGLRHAPATSVVNFSMRAGEKLDEAATAKAVAEQKAREEAEAAVKIAALKPIVADFPSREQMWSFADAGRVGTAAREKISLNGLWAFKVDNDPEDIRNAPAVAGMKDFFKVPGRWPEGGRHARDGMAVYTERGADHFGNGIDKIESAWYGRTVEVPLDWHKRRVILGFRWVPSAVVVYVDGAKAGEVFFPGGEIDLTAKLSPGKHELALFASAKLPEKMMQVFDAPDQARTVSKKEIKCKGIHGDVYLAAEPTGVKIDDVQVRSHVKDGRIDFSLGFAGEGTEPVTAVADIYDGARKVKSVTSAPFTAKAGERFVFGDVWKEAKVWDTDCPENVYTVKVRLEKDGRVVDELYPEEFGFREVTIAGRDLLLNGKPLHLRPEYSCLCGASAVANDEAEESFRRMRAHGFNFEIDGAYGFAEGDLADFEFSLRAASRVGMPSVCGLPHPCHFAPPDKPLAIDLTGRYLDILKYEIKQLQNIPGLLLWSSTHNQTGYESDQNPELMTGQDEDVPDGILGWRKSFRNSSKEVNRLLRDLDPGRPVYHHESGKNGEFYTLNSYLDWAPIQERSDWLEKWEEEGVLPLLLVEWGAPHIASWSSYRGEDNGRNIWSSFGNCKWAWINEYNCTFLGEEAFIHNDVKHRWHEITPFYCKGNKDCYYGGFDQITHIEPDMKKVTAMYMKRNIRDMRARGATMILPWDIGSTHFTWAEGARDKHVREKPLDGIKAFGAIRSDYSFGFLNLGGQIPAKGTGETMVETYTDIIGWIAGPTDKDFTCVNDTFRKGEKVEKSLMIVNDSRRDRTVRYAWKAGSESGAGSVVVEAGRRKRIAIAFTASADGAIEADFGCDETGWTYHDQFPIHVIGPKTMSSVESVALFDPDGTAKPVLDAIGVKAVAVDAVPKTRLLVIGRNAYAKLPFALGDALDIGVKVVMLEQDTETLKKLGFRIQEYGLRQVFANVPEFAGLDLSDWRGNATMLPWYLPVDRQSGDFPRWKWEGFEHTRVWRAGNRGIVSCALPEKPSRGDFKALVSGGFNLQYAPVMEYASGNRRVIFSQLDICGRSEPSPEAEAALAKILDYANRPMATKTANVLVMEGQNNVEKTFGDLGISFAKAASASDAKPGDVLVLGPGAKPGDVTELVKNGVKVLALGLTGDEVNAAYPSAKAESCRRATDPDLHPAIGKEPLFEGVSNADIQWSYPECMATMAKFDGRDVLKAFHDGEGAFVANAVVPWRFDEKELALRHNRRRAQALVTRLVANLGGAVADVAPGTGVLYADKPESIDDPYRYFRW